MGELRDTAYILRETIEGEAVGYYDCPVRSRILLDDIGGVIIENLAFDMKDPDTYNYVVTEM